MVIGHKKILDFLDKIAEKNSAANAYVFLGPEHLGKFTVALEFARKLSGGEEGAINPDLLVVEPEVEEKKGIKKKKQIKIEKIRELNHWLSLSSFGTKKRVAIINEAEWLNLSSQNALLKTLEEPQENAAVILVTASGKKLLPTILSRCQKIRFNPVSDSEIKKAAGDDIKNIEEIIFWSLGRPGLFMDLIKSQDELDLRKDSVRELKSLFEKNVTEKFSFAESISKDTPALMKKLDFWRIILREALLNNSSGIGISPLKAMDLIERISSCLEFVSGTNVNAKLLTENLFLYF